MRDSGTMTRRNLLCASASAGALATFSITPSLANQSVHGRVLELRTGAPKGIAHALVSNGVEVVSTNDEGFYCLPARDGVFVIKPAHWSVPLDLLTGVPAFSSFNRLSCSHAGATHSAWTAHEPNLQSIDFFLERSPEPKAFSAALFADPQPADEREMAFLNCAMNKLCAGRDFSFGLALGDIASDNLTIYEGYKRQTARLGVPVWHIPGNHDHDRDATDAHGRLNTWRANFGPPTYAFEFGGALFIMLDNVKTQSDGSYVGAIGAGGLAFVRNLLACTPREKLVVVCTHIPLVSSNHNEPSCITADTQALLALLEGRRSVSFAGHMHTSEHHYLPHASGAHHHQIIAALSGSWWSGPFDENGRPLAVSSDGTPNGWHVLSIDGPDYHTEFVSAHDNAIARAIVQPSAIGAKPVAGLEIIDCAPGKTNLMVNVFDGGPRTNVFIDIDGARHTLRRVDETDPYTQMIFHSAGDLLKHWVSAEISSHLWALDRSDLPQPGLERAYLTIVDEFGRTRLQNVQLFAS